MTFVRVLFLGTLVSAGMLAARGGLAWALPSQSEILTFAGGLITAGGLLLIFYQRVSKARREEFKEWDAVTAPSFSKKVDDLTATIGTMRQSLHAARNEANDHAVQAAGLRSDLQETNALLLEAQRELFEASKREALLYNELTKLRGELSGVVRVQTVQGSQMLVQAGFIETMNAILADRPELLAEIIRVVKVDADGPDRMSPAGR